MAKPLYFYLFCTITRASVSVQCANIGRTPVQHAAVNMHHSGKINAVTSGSVKI